MSQQWKVGDVQSVTYTSSMRNGFGFSIQNSRGAPFLSFSYDSEAEAKKAQASVREAVASAADIMKG